MEFVNTLGLVGQRQLEHVMHAMRGKQEAFDLTFFGVRAARNVDSVIAIVIILSVVHSFGAVNCKTRTRNVQQLV